MRVIRAHAPTKNLARSVCVDHQRLGPAGRDARLPLHGAEARGCRLRAEGDRGAHCSPGRVIESGPRGG